MQYGRQRSPIGIPQPAVHAGLQHVIRDGIAESATRVKLMNLSEVAHVIIATRWRHSLGSHIAVNLRV